MKKMITKFFGHISTLFFQSRPISPTTPIPLLLIIITMSNPSIIPTAPIIRDSRVASLRKKASLKLNVLTKVGQYMNLAQRRSIMKAFICSEFGYWYGCFTVGK